MTKEAYRIIGVMSGTSLDGIDLVYASFNPKGWQFSILKAETIPYSKIWQQTLKESVNLERSELKELDLRYTDLLAKVILKFITQNNIKSIDAVCSHGHTVLHQPIEGITYQIGNRPELAAKIGHKVVCDFRVQDVELGGEGAPLVPIGDHLLFSDYGYCLNLGGFANISFEKNHQRSAYDICPVNIVMNHYCKKIDLEYDEGGHLAAQGKINVDLLKELNALSFYKQEPPKSLGLEWVQSEVIPLIDSYKLSTNDILRTMVEHVAFQIAQSTNNDHKGSILVTGGGTYNDFLLSRLKDLCQNELVIPSKEIIDYKEALIFGLLGVLKLRNEINCLSSATGASHDHSSGKIFLA